MTLKKHIIGL